MKLLVTFGKQSFYYRNVSITYAGIRIAIAQAQSCNHRLCWSFSNGNSMAEVLQNFLSIGGCAVLLQKKVDSGMNSFPIVASDQIHSKQSLITTPVTRIINLAFTDHNSSECVMAACLCSKVSAGQKQPHETFSFAQSTNIILQRQIRILRFPTLILLVYNYAQHEETIGSGFLDYLLTLARAKKIATFLVNFHQTFYTCSIFHFPPFINGTQRQYLVLAIETQQQCNLWRG